MGLMRFLVTPPERLTPEMAQQAMLSGVDRGCWQTRITLDAGELTLERSNSESANLQLPWPVDGRGWVTLCTGSLMERPEPYALPLELARGVVYQLRHQLFDWQSIGLAVPKSTVARVAEATSLLGQAAVRQDETALAADRAETAIRTALEAGDLLVSAYVEAAAHSGRRTGTRMNGLLGADLGRSVPDDALAAPLLGAISAACVPMRWSQIENSDGELDWSLTDRQFEFCAAHGLKVLAGPLAWFDSSGIPDGLYLWQGDFESIANFLTHAIEGAVKRYQGKVDAWIAAGRVNTGKVLGLSEEDKLRLTAHAIEVIHAIDPKTPVLCSFDQPWGEYLTRRPMDVPPLHFVDALVRAELNLSGLMWEVNVGCLPGGTAARTVFEFSRHLDLWSSFGLPLWVGLSAPSETTADPQAARSIDLPAGSWSPKGQQAWAARYVPLLLAKPNVQGVIWRPLRDAEPHDFPHTGLFDAEDQPKPVLEKLGQFRQSYLQRSAGI